MEPIWWVVILVSTAITMAGVLYFANKDLGGPKK